MPSFDIVSKTDVQEVDNAVNQAIKEMQQRYDFKGTKSEIKWEKKEEITVLADDDGKLRSILDILQTKLVKRGVSLKSLDYGKEEDSREIVSLRAYLPLGEEGKLKAIRAQLGRIGWRLKTSALKETDWSQKWKKGLRPIRVTYKGASIVIKPTWKKSAKRPGEKIIEIDPGMAFGTGGHATTKMCLKAILRLVKDKLLPPAHDNDILDVGTGTGVLAIAAMKLGFRKAVGIDIDRVAVDVAKKNARDNRAKVTLSARPVETIRGRFSLVAANILAGELIRLSPPIKDRGRPGGWLILSGIP